MMPTADNALRNVSGRETREIAADFARQYDLDLQGIDHDTERLRVSLAGQVSGTAAGPSVSYTYQGTDAFVPDLETIDGSSDVDDLDVSPRHVELNFEESTKLADVCIRLRSVYAELAKHRNDTRFKGEEFVRLDAVHLQEIDAGLFQLPWQEASEEADGLRIAVDQAARQQAIPDAMTGAIDSGELFDDLLSQREMAKQIELNAFITRSIANTAKDQVEQNAALTSAYKMHMEYAAWQETLASSKALVAQLSAKLSTAERKEAFLRQDEAFKLQRSNVSRQLAWMQIAEHSRLGSELNYDQRLRVTRLLFNENLLLLVRRVLALSKGMHDSYGITLGLGDLVPGSVLDQVLLWLVQATDALSKWKRKLRLSIVQVASPQLASSGAAGGMVLTVLPSHLPSSTSLLRGINFEYLGAGQAPISLGVAPPDQALVGRSREPLHFGRVCPMTSALDIRPQYAEILWNGSPLGDWTVAFGDLSGSRSFDQVIMYLWLASP